MTWSVVAFDPAAGAFGVAVASRAFAIGARMPHVRAGVGAVATQSIANAYLGPRVLGLLAAGVAPSAAIEEALDADGGRALRQLHAVDRHGRSAAWTGRHCVEWAGVATGEGVSVAGNMLANERVVAATLAGFAAAAGPLAERLVAALEAGEAAGGDRRGRQAAVLLAATTEDFPEINLRVDDHVAPLAELRRLLGLYREQLEPNAAIYPSKANPSGMTDLDAIEARWRARGLELRFRR
jgi:uncharacterized Ntn-hydrolase superfamily protein